MKWMKRHEFYSDMIQLKTTRNLTPNETILISDRHGNKKKNKD